MLTVRELRADQLDEAVEAIVGGFEQDPNFVHIIPDGSVRLKVMRLLMRSLTGIAISSGGAYVVLDDGEIIGGVVGYPPGGYPLSFRQEARLAPTYLRVFATSPRLAARLLRLYYLALSHHPQGERYWYLLGIGVRPGDRSIQALKLVFDAVIERVDADGAGAYLETTRPELTFAVSRYFGFEVRAHDVRLVKGGPPNWLLWRPARDPRPAR